MTTIEVNIKDYGDPSDEGWEAVGSLSSSMCYEWDQVDVWHKDGVFAWYADSGCSCNSAYDYSSVTLEVVDDEASFGRFEKAVDSLYDNTPVEKREFIAKIRQTVFHGGTWK